MKFIYPAVISKKENGAYHAVFPDLATCEADGDSLDECLDNANAAASDWIALELSEEEPDLPGVSEHSDISLADGEIVRNICVTIRLYEGWDE